MTRYMPWMVSALLALLGALPGAAEAAWPERPIRIVVPYPPGGTTDLLARLVAAPLGEALGQSIVIDNRSGGNGTIGTVAVARAEPDGYTLVAATIGTHGINPSLKADLPYDPVTDFAPITVLGSTPNVISVHPSVPATSLDALLALARAQPGKLNFGSTSSGGSPHMSGELLKMLAKVDIVHVPYRGGGPMLNDLIAGQVQIGIDNLPSSIGHIRAGSIRAIAVTSAARWPDAPDIPTVSESGLPDYEVSAWFGLLAPARTPPDIVALLHRHVAAILARPAFARQMLEMGGAPGGNTPAEFGAMIVREVARWRAVVAATGAKAD